jgi:Xaa-Pro aminopeptidase
MNNMRRERVLSLLPEAMMSHSVDLWLIFTRELSRDPIASDFAAGDVVGRTALLFALTDEGFQRIAIAASYDMTLLENSGLYDKIMCYGREGISALLRQLIEKFSPKRIAVNTSRDISLADGLSSGMLQFLREALGPGICEKFVSAEFLIASFRSRKLPKEIDILREAAVITDEIIRRALSCAVVKPGRTTENDIANFLVRCADEIGAQVPFLSVIAGVSRGHSRPSDRIVRLGDLLRIDFGITYKGYCTDIQRTAYILPEGEQGAPAVIERMWSVCRDALDHQLRTMKPGITGNEIDTIARKLFAKSGFEGPPHGTGHCIGLSVHDAGPLLGPDWPDRYGCMVFLSLEEGQTFAVEPLLYADYAPMGGQIHIGLEEDVVVTASGVDPLHPSQKRLILI